MTSLDAASVGALAARLRSLAAQLTEASATAPEAGERGCPPPLRSAAAAAASAGPALAALADDAGAALTAYAYAAAALDRDLALLTAEASELGFVVAGAQISARPGVRGLVRRDLPAGTPATLATLRRRHLSLQERRAALEQQLRDRLRAGRAGATRVAAGLR